MEKILIGLMAFASFAATAASFSYQGVLKTAEGNEVKEKNQAITFRLYDKAESELTQALWGRKVSVLLDKDGLFNVELSDSAGSAVEGLASTLDQILSQYGNSTLYIGLFVDGSSGEIRPRQKVLAVPTASFAQDVKTARNGFNIAGSAKINGALTVEKGATLTGNATINQLTVSKGTTLNGATKIEKLMVGGIDYVSIPTDAIILMKSGASVPKGWRWIGAGNMPGIGVVDYYIRKE